MKMVDRSVTMTSVTHGVPKSEGKKESKMKTENKKFKEKENPADRSTIRILLIHG